MWLDNVELKAIARQIGMTPVDWSYSKVNTKLLHW